MRRARLGGGGLAARGPGGASRAPLAAPARHARAAGCANTRRQPRTRPSRKLRTWGGACARGRGAVRSGEREKAGMAVGGSVHEQEELRLTPGHVPRAEVSLSSEPKPMMVVHGLPAEDSATSRAVRPTVVRADAAMPKRVRAAVASFARAAHQDQL